VTINGVPDPPSAAPAPGGRGPDPNGPELNPAQARVSALLRTPGDARPAFDADLADRLRHELEEAIAPAAAALAVAEAKPMYIGKSALGSVHGCEARHLELERQPFQLGPHVVAGTVAHRAIQYSQHWDRAPIPAELVDGALERLAEEQDRNGVWFAGASSIDRAEVRGAAVDRVTKFLECFPPLRRSWLPVLESPLRAELAGGRIVLSGRVDLVLGRTSGLVAGKAFVDFKTGARFAGHVDDLRFYALLELLRLGVPPFRLASYYLDQGDLVSEDVTEAVLAAAAARAADGVVKVVELRLAQRDPTRRPGPSCRRCPLVASCDEAWRDDDRDGDRDGDREDDQEGGGDGPAAGGADP
jgi:hypothetical protein